MTPAASGIVFVKRRSLVCFFVLAYGLSWGFYLLSLTWKGFPFLFPFGSALSALIVAGMACGKDGLKDVLHRCLLWRVRPSAPVGYFRMEVPNAAGELKSWGVALNLPRSTAVDPSDIAKLKVGTRVVAVGNVANDGSNRIYLVPLTGPSTVFGIDVIP